MYKLTPVLALALMTCAGIPSSTFEANDDGWTLSNNGVGSKPLLRQQDGNPSGQLCGTDSDATDIWYFVAPPEYLGNEALAYGKRLTFDLRQSESFNQIHGRDVVLNGAGLAVTVSLRATPGRDWTPYSITLDAKSGWTLDDRSGRGNAASEADLRSVLGALTALRIRGEYVTSAGSTTCLDNVYFGHP